MLLWRITKMFWASVAIGIVMLFGALLIVPWAAWHIARGFFAGVRAEVRKSTAWRLVRIENGWDYSINARTGQRRAVYATRKNAAGPVDRRWLREGDLLIDEDGRRVIIAKTNFGVSVVSDAG